MEVVGFFNIGTSKEGGGGDVKHFPGGGVVVVNLYALLVSY